VFKGVADGLQNCSSTLDTERLMPALPSGTPIDAAWLSHQLGQTVDRLEIVPLGVPQGMVSSTLRLQLHGQSTDLPASLILKIDSDNPAGREMAQALNCFQREVGFYREFGPDLSDCVPRCHACGDGTSDDGRWLLLEDLTAMKAGNQVRGISAEATLRVIEAMADVQARFWQAAELERHAWIPAHQVWFQGSSATLASYRQSFLDDYALRVDAEALEAIDRIIERSRAIDGAMAKRPWTLVHGDLRAENVLFATDSCQRDAVVLDWGTPTRSLAALDLAFLIGGSVPMPARRGRIRELCDHWHQALQRRGVSRYTSQEAWADLQLATLRCLTSVLLLHHWQLDPTVSARVMLLQDESIERFCGMAVEVRALEALPD
jgi:hypothetical protein